MVDLCPVSDNQMVWNLIDLEALTLWNTTDIAQKILQNKP